MWVWMWMACRGSPAGQSGGGAGDVRVDVAVPADGTTPPVAADEPAPSITSANCGDLEDGGAPAGPDCISGTLSCGDTVAGHTRGGSHAFDTRFYESKYCTPATTRHDTGGERVYALTMPEGDHRARIFLDSPCADLDLAAIRVPDPKSCTRVPPVRMS